MLRIVENLSDKVESEVYSEHCQISSMELLQK